MGWRIFGENVKNGFEDRRRENATIVGDSVTNGFLPLDASEHAPWIRSEPSRDRWAIDRISSPPLPCAGEMMLMKMRVEHKEEKASPESPRGVTLLSSYSL